MPYTSRDIGWYLVSLFILLWIAPLILKYQMQTGHFKMFHINVFLTTLIAFQLIEACSRSKQKRIFKRGHVTNDVMKLSLIWELFYDKCHYLMELHPSGPQIEQAIWHWTNSSCKGFWEGSYYNHILLLLSLLLLFTHVPYMLLSLLIFGNFLSEIPSPSNPGNQESKLENSKLILYIGIPGGLIILIVLTSAIIFYVRKHRV